MYKVPLILIDRLKIALMIIDRNIAGALV